jgi:ABC-type nitrate/sulfonate/bicarbonate transport system permease component
MATNVKKKITLSFISWITSALLLVVIILVSAGFQVPLFFGAFFVSLLRILAAYIVATLIGAIVAFLFWKIKFLKKFFVPILEGMQSFPALLLLPLAAIWFGFNNFAIIFFLVFLIIWPIIFSTFTSLESMPRDWQEAAKVFGATGIKKILYLILPTMFPGIITGSVIGWGSGWNAIVAAEILTAADKTIQPGIGAGLWGLAKSGSPIWVLLSGIMAFLIIIIIFNKFIWRPLLDKAELFTE